MWAVIPSHSRVVALREVGDHAACDASDAFIDLDALELVGPSRVALHWPL